MKELNTQIKCVNRLIKPPYPVLIPLSQIQRTQNQFLKHVKTMEIADICIIKLVCMIVGYCYHSNTIDYNIMHTDIHEKRVKYGH